MIGQTISHYRIIEKCGEGGMGVVYKAEDTKLKREVAIKFLPKQIADDNEERERLKIEAQAAAALNHPNITIIHAIEEYDDDLFIVMEYIDGQSLKEMIDAGPLKVEEALKIAMQIAEGLHAAHDNDVIHRDIKSSNIIVTGLNQVKIMDFGIAKVRGESKLTKTGTTIGTLAYMSPQQARGQEVDHRTDIWSLGVVLYEMVTSRLPFEEENEAALILSVISKPVLPPTELDDGIPKELENIILKCLYKEIDHRYSSAQLILKDLKKLEETLQDAKRERLTLPTKESEVRKETERRQATVMYAEISGYGDLMESMDAEEAASTLNSCFKMLDSIVNRYGGEINKIMENNIEVLFGVPMAIEDAPKEAVNAAIAMRNKLELFNQENNLTVPLEIHIGINTGVVIAGGIGTDTKQDYTVMGDTVIVASQLKDLSDKGQIYVGLQTYKHTRDDFEFEALKPVSLKGETEPVAVYMLASFREKLYRPPVGLKRIIYSEMVGREKELDKLRLHVLKALNGEGSIVNVVGEAGIGKSRLVTELAEREELEKVTLLRGRALSIGAHLSFHPIIDFLRRWARIKEEDPPATSAQKLEETIRRLYPEQVSEIFPFIATLMSLKLTGKHAERLEGIEGDALEKLILKNVRDLIVKAASINPLVVILEDLHWADLTTVDLLESLYRLAESTGILFINVMRPDYETGERVLSTVRSRYPSCSVDIYLEPLDDSQCETLIRNLLQVVDLPLQIRELIARRAEGNPFFIEEVARSFIDDGVVVIEDGHFRVTSKIDSVIIPETINDVIMARVDKLEERTRSLLKVASVIGRNFFYKILTKVAYEVEDVDERLELLKEVQLIRERRRTEELEYLFKHALARDAVYSSIPQKKRKQLHLDVARSIESVFSEKIYEFYGRLAFHYSRADEMEKAEEYLLKAGEEALKAAASNEALVYFQDALDLYLRTFGDAVKPEKIAGLHKKIGIALYFKAHFAESVEHFDEALTYWGMRRPKSKIKAGFRLLIDLLWMIKEINFPSRKLKKIPGEEENDILSTSYRKISALISIDTHRMFTEAIGLFRKVGKYDLTKLEHGLAFLSGFSALFSYSGVSIKIGNKILDYFKPYLTECDDRTLFAYNFWKLVCEYVSGDWNGERDLDEELIDTMVLKGETWNAPGYAGMLSFIQTELGYFSISEKCCNKFQEIADLFEDEYHKARKSTYYTKFLLRSGRLYDVLNESEEMINLNNKFGQRLTVIYLLGIKANAQILLGDIDGAENTLLQAEDPVSREKRISPLMISSYLTSQLLLNLHRLERANNGGDKSGMKQFRKRALHFGRASLRNSRKFAAEQTTTLRLMGVYFWLLGRQKKAITWWEKSIKNGEELHARPELARTYMEVGKRMLEVRSRIDQLNGIGADEYLEKARYLFMELGIERDLDELNVVLS